MGWDIFTIGKHTLDNSNVFNLALDIQKRINVRVNYGYYKRNVYDKKSNRIRLNYGKYKSLGKIYPLNTKKEFKLVDQNYDYRMIENILGNNIENLKWKKKDREYESDKYFISEYMSYKEKECFDLTIPKRKPKSWSFEGAYIYKEVVMLHYFFPCRWFGFMNCFTEDGSKDPEDEKMVKKMRQDMKEYYSYFGCDSIIYFPDQGPTQLICDHLHEPYKNILSYIRKKKYYDESLKHVLENEFNDESTINTEREIYKEKGKSVQLNMPQFFKKKQRLLAKGTHIEVFYDDFSDLEYA